MQNPFRPTARLGKSINRIAWLAPSARRREGVRDVPVAAGGPGDRSRVCAVDGGAFIEPSSGYVIRRGGGLVEDSTTPNFDHGGAPWRQAVPSPIGFARLRRDPRTTFVRHEAVISLRHWWEWNYYHFFLDVLGKLPLFEEAGLGRDIPLVVGRYALHLPLFTEVLSSGPFADRTWIIPDRDDRTVVEADTVYYCVTQRSYRSRVQYIREHMAAPIAPADADDRIFLTRSPGSTRMLTNEAEVQPVLRHHGFRTVEASVMTVREQAELFSTARYVIALHGAGVTNVLFREGAPLGVLELHSTEFAGPGDIQRLCRELGFAWADLSGPPTTAGAATHADFRIDPAALDAAIGAMVSGSSAG